MLDLGTCYVVWIIVIAIFLLGLPITNLVLSIKSLGKKPEASANIKLDELNAKALKSVTVKGNEIYLKRKEGIKKIWVDIVYFFGKKKQYLCVQLFLKLVFREGKCMVFQFFSNFL